MLLAEALKCYSRLHRAALIMASDVWVCSLRPNTNRFTEILNPTEWLTNGRNNTGPSSCQYPVGVYFVYGIMVSNMLMTWFNFIVSPLNISLKKLFDRLASIAARKMGHKRGLRISLRPTQLNSSELNSTRLS